MQCQEAESAMMHSPKHDGLLGLLIQSKRDLTGNTHNFGFWLSSPCSQQQLLFTSL